MSYDDEVWYASLSEDERRAYDADVKAYRDYVGQLSWAEEQGWKQGWEIGRKQGWEQVMKEVAKKMKVLGIDIQIISQSTGLSIASINEL